MSTYTIASGDTFTTIASALGLGISALEQANPGLDPTNLQVGQVIRLPQSGTRYTIQAGDTLTTIAERFGTTVAALQAANLGINPNDLRVGAMMNVPATSGPSQPTTPAPPAPPTKPTKQGQYTIQAGDTFTSIAARFSVSVAAIEDANPGVRPEALQVGQIINLPSSSGPSTSPTTPSSGGGGNGTGSGSEVGRGKVIYSGPASFFPNPSNWASYGTLWAKNSSLMSYSDSASEIGFLGSSISIVAAESGLDARFILCVIMQESGGNVRVGNTFNGVNNTGIMQAYNGGRFDERDPQGSILRMVRDGSEGTAAGPGLKQAYTEFGNYYEAARKYNSGSVDRNDLGNGRGATPGYVSDLANRLMGHVWAGM